MKIDWLDGVPDSNFSRGRSGNPITYIVDHWMGTANAPAGALFDSAVKRFSDPSSIVSAHYLIGQDGRVAQMVLDDDTAYQAGVWQANVLSIGIEHEASPTQVPSDALYAASAALHALLAQRHGLRLEVGVTVKPHHAIVPTACPGTLDLDRIVEEAMGVTGDQVKDLIREMLESEEGAALVYDAITHKYGPALEAELQALAARLEAADNITEIKAVVEALLGVQPFALKPAP